MNAGSALQSLPGSDIARRVAAGYWAGALLFIGWTAFLALRDHGVVPRVDEAMILHDMYTMPFVEWLFSIQSGHRLPLTRLLVAADLQLFDGQNHLLIVSSLAMLVISSLVLWRGLRLGGGLDEPFPRLAFGLITLTLFWSASVFNLLCGVCNGNVVVVLFSLISLTCLVDHACARREGRRSAGGLVFSILAGMLATAGMGHGIAIWPALVTVGLCARLPLRDVAAIALAAIIVGGFFAMGTVADVGGQLGRSPVAIALAHPLELLRFTLILIGSAVARTVGSTGLLDQHLLEMSSLFGIGGFVGAVAFATWTWRSTTPPSPQSLLAIGIMALAAAIAFGVGANRLFALGPDQALAPRFFDWSALFWVGVAVALCTLVPTGTRWFWIAAIQVALVTVLLVTSLPKLRAGALAKIAGSEDAAAAFLVGVAGPFEHRRLYPREPAKLRELMASLRSERKSFFASPRSEWMGRSMTELFSRAADGSCRGALKRGPARIRGSHGVTVGGWAWDDEHGAPPESIVLIDEHGVVEGLGNIKHSKRPPHTADDARRVTWKAWGTVKRKKSDYAVYGIVDDGRRACHLAGREAPLS